MPKPSNAQAPATCGDVQTGSTRVFFEGKGASRVEVDLAVGLIIGPGSQNVFVEGKKLSLEGDAVAGHGLSPHSAPVTTSTLTKVNVGTGFLGDVDPETGESISTGDAPKPDLILTSFTTNYGSGEVTVFASGTGQYPPTNMTNAYWYCNENTGVGVTIPPPPPNITYSYSVKNNGQDTSQPFDVGFWRFTDVTNAPDVAILTVQAAELYPDAQLVGTQSVQALPPGGTFNGTFVFPQTYTTSIGEYVFGVYPDVYQTVTEPNEQNSAPTIRVVVSNSCG